MSNPDFYAATFKVRPMGLMKQDVFSSFINENGLTSFAGHFYNNHEPFLNKRTPDYVRVASDLRIETLISSNLSFSKIDAEAIVASGLKELMVAIDGVTQETYEKYRRGGKIEWVLANARAIAQAKIKLGSATPRLRWQYLTFAHNLHEVPAAIKLAREIGFDTFNLASPHDVSADDPNVVAVEYPGGPDSMAQVFSEPVPFAFTGNLAPYAEAIETRLEENAEAGWLEKTGGIDQYSETKDRCDWLYLAPTIDGAGRVDPCCIPDHAGDWTFQFRSLPADAANIMSLPDYEAGRLAVIDPQRLMKEIGDKKAPRCHGCHYRPRPQVGLGAIGGYVLNAPELANMPFLHGWSAHRIIYQEGQ
jgi:MoaA/NifB/PqqE/SkfB family radical SAM enzyme